MSKRLYTHLRWLRFSLSFIGGALVLLLALPFAVPLEHYIPQIQTRASEQLHEPVVIGSLNIQLLPLPGVVLRHVRVGRLPDASIDSLRIGIDLRSLFKPVKVVNSVDLTGLRLRPAGLEKFPLWFKIEGPQQVELRSVRIHRSHLVLPKLVLGPLEADIHLTAHGDFMNALVSGDDGRLKIAVQPERENYRLDVRARHWQAPLGPPLLFEELSGTILATADKMYMQPVSGKLYAGSFTGNAELGWKDTWYLNGRFAAHDVQIKPLITLFSRGVSASGAMSVRASFAANAYASEYLLNNIKADAAFSIQQGVLYNIDLAKAAQALKQNGVSGGETRFDEFTGSVNIANREYHFQDLHVTSGLLDGSGDVDVAADKTLSGPITVALKGSAGLINAPLEAAGTVDNPELRFSRSALAGAVAGTVVLGPGMGTSLGMRAGALAGKLGGMFKDRAPDKKTESK